MAGLKMMDSLPEHVDKKCVCMLAILSARVLQLLLFLHKAGRIQEIPFDPRTQLQQRSDDEEEQEDDALFTATVLSRFEKGVKPNRSSLVSSFQDSLDRAQRSSLGGKPPAAGKQASSVDVDLAQVAGDGDLKMSAERVEFNELPHLHGHVLKRGSNATQPDAKDPASFSMAQHMVHWVTSFEPVGKPTEVPDLAIKKEKGHTYFQVLPYELNNHSQFSSMMSKFSIWAATPSNFTEAEQKANLPKRCAEAWLQFEGIVRALSLYRHKTGEPPRTEPAPGWSIEWKVTATYVMYIWYYFVISGNLAYLTAKHDDLWARAAARANAAQICMDCGGDHVKTACTAKQGKNKAQNNGQQYGGGNDFAVRGGRGRFGPWRGRWGGRGRNNSRYAPYPPNGNPNYGTYNMGGNYNMPQGDFGGFPPPMDGWQNQGSPFMNPFQGESRPPRGNQNFFRGRGGRGF